jgi:hypothetical protein
MRIAIINGRVSTPEEARISVYDRGFLYGDSIFETVRTYGGKAFALGEHLARLARSAERLFIELPVSLDVISAEVEQGIARAQNPESFARIMITRGSGPLGLDPALARDPNRIILVEPFVPPPSEAYENGIEAITFRTVRSTDATPAAGAKVANYLTSVLAIREARKHGARGRRRTSSWSRGGSSSPRRKSRASSPESRAPICSAPPQSSGFTSTYATSASKNSPLPTSFSSRRRCAKYFPSSVSTDAPSVAGSPVP